jgi:hypothetical protein
MAHPHHFELNEAESIGDRLGIDWVGFDVEQFRKGLEVEFEHGARDPQTNITNDDPLLTGKIAWAHLKAIPDYYDRLEEMDAEGQAYWEAAQSG